MVEVNYSSMAGMDDVFSSCVEEEARPHNNEMNLAWQFITSTNVSVFLTGKAGTGKTTFLKKLKELMPKRMVVLAPTGVAAINAQGQTIHSFFQLPFGPMVPGVDKEPKSHYRMSKDKKNLIKTLDLLVIDEISMVRCDLLDAIDGELRKYRDRSKPFGGVQLLLIGDLQQLAPVAKDSEWHLLSPYYSTPYFFGSKALQQIPYVTIELKHIYRQQDSNFIDILAKIRANNIDQHVVKALNDRHVPGFVPPVGEDWIRLTTHNRMAQQYNEEMLSKLDAREMRFHAAIHKNFPESSYPADEELVLKSGAQVMFIKNDPSGNKSYYNGKIGVVNGVAFDDDTNQQVISVYCQEDDTTIKVPPVTWENTKYVIDEDSKEIKEVVDGTFTQYPLRLAWAITVHKSQGLTFDHAVLDINESFTHGQVYVALSRCRTLEGMVLARPLTITSVITDANVNAYIDRELSEAQHAASKLPKMKYDYFLMLLGEMFDFRIVKQDLAYLTRVVDEHLYSSCPDLLMLLKEMSNKLDAEIVSIALKFQNQYMQLMSNSGTSFATDETLHSRLKAAMGYFHEKLSDILIPIVANSKVLINNKQIATQYGNALDSFFLSMKVKVGVMARLQTNGFSVKAYLEAKAKSALDSLMGVEQKPKSKKVKQPKNEKPKKVKGETKLESYRLFREGKSIAEIAVQRGLTEGTIGGHLAYYVQQGELQLDELVPHERQVAIRNVVDSFTNATYSLTDIKAALPDDYSFAEIRLVIKN